MAGLSNYLRIYFAPSRTFYTNRDDENKEETILSFNFIFTKYPVKEGFARSPGRVLGGEEEVLA